MGKVLKIGAGLVGLIVIIIGVVFWMTSGMADTANAFFADIRAGDYDSAYDHLSEAFIASTSKDDLIEFLENYALVQVEDTSWNSRSISGGQGKLEGSVTTESGAVFPLTLQFVKEQGTWKLLSIHKPRVGISEDIETPSMPSEDACLELVHESLLKFAQAVNARDFTAFYEDVAQFWQKEITVAKFNEIFKPFMDAEIDLVPALNVQRPQFDAEPSMGEDGFVILKGHYPTKPSRLTFELSYLYEGLAWKLVGTNVNVTPVE